MFFILHSSLLIIAYFTQNIALNIALVTENGHCRRLVRSGMLNGHLRPGLGGFPRDSLAYRRDYYLVTGRLANGQHLAAIGTHLRATPRGCLISPVDALKGVWGYGRSSSVGGSSTSLLERLNGPISHARGIVLQLWSVLRPFNLPFTLKWPPFVLKGPSFEDLPCKKVACRFANSSPGRILARVLRPLHSLYGRYKFMKQLDSIKVYTAVDNYGAPILSHYPGVSYPLSNRRIDSQDGSSCTDSHSGSLDGHHTSHSGVFARLLSSLRRLFACTYIHFDREKRCPFGALFSKEQGQNGYKKLNMLKVDVNANKVSSTVYLYFADKDACEAHVKELLEKGVEAHVKEVSLGDYLRRSWENKPGSWFGKPAMHILLPSQVALLKATKEGSVPFEGTPVFVTEPPIVCTDVDCPVTTECGQNGGNLGHHYGENNKWDDITACNAKVALFMDPNVCLEVYKKINSAGQLVKVVNGKRVFMKILGKGTSSPEVKAASLEDLYRGVCKDGLFSGNRFFLVATK